MVIKSRKNEILNRTWKLFVKSYLLLINFICYFIIMKLRKIFFVISLICFVWFTYAITNISQEDLDSIINEVNQEIQNEITISYPEDSWMFDISSWNELELAIQTLYKFKSTKFNNLKDFMPDKNIRRDEAAKMYLQFASWASILPNKQNNECKFWDLKNAWPDIIPMIWEVCKYWLFKWYNWKFMPTENITKWQAVVVLIRLIVWPQSEQWVKHYAQNYILKAQELGLLDWLWLDDSKTWDQPATRGFVAKLLYRWYKYLKSK